MIILEKTCNIIEKAKKYLPRKYKAELLKKVTYEESLCSRFLIAKLIENSFGIKKYFVKTQKDGTPIWEDDIYWSISHKRGHILIGVDTKPIGVDVEIYRKRTVSIFSYMDRKEWKVLGEKNWENFYIGWTAKEAALKSDLGVLDDLSKYKIVAIHKIENKHSSYSNEIEIINNEKKYTLLCGKRNQVYYSRTI